MSIRGGCGKDDCCASTGIHDTESSRLSGMTFGSGRLDHNGYWEFPCGPCARAFEQEYPEAAPCWPFPGEESEGSEGPFPEFPDIEEEIDT